VAHTGARGACGGGGARGDILVVDVKLFHAGPDTNRHDLSHTPFISETTLF
jgi:hypothetical protein